MVTPKKRPFKLTTHGCVTALFLVVLTAAYITLTVLDLTTKLNLDDVRYIGILLCLAYATFNAAYCRTKVPVLTAFALLFTAVADWFLLVVDDYYEWGLAAFIVAQTLHATRLFSQSGRNPKYSVWVRLGLTAAVVVILQTTNELTLLTLLVAVYFPNLLMNAADSVVDRKKNKAWLLLALGFVLFVGCDICVGLYNFGDVLGESIPTTVYNFANFGMWTFYLPSQILLSVSAHPAFLEKTV